MGKQTPLFDEHVALDARLVDFAGWDMPIDYGSQIKEHNAVREHAGMFDVSHMSVVDIAGAGARDFLRRVLANDVAKAEPVGRAIYSCMLNTRGGVIDDLIVYRLADAHYRVVVNAATTEKDLAWLASCARDYDVDVTLREDLAIIAVQGPEAREAAHRALDSELADPAMELQPFEALMQGDWSIGRTGYTGEDGFEIVLPAAAAAKTWRALQKTGVTPVGLGARDTLRLEAGLCLYGQDMDEDVSPLASGLAWTVAFEPAERHFIGRESLEYQREQGVEAKLVGLVLDGRGVIRSGAAARAGDDDKTPSEQAAGRVTSGSFSPTLSRSIALARVPADWQERVEVIVRDEWKPARIVAYPFVRNGKIRVEI